ncbi:hypothetical protein O7628_32165 [Micromonospora sp. WMMD956]|uniref:hypothetical protein n=1 Tax=Micromonospora sp. WMMD956 TaxID=3016108 RepID=UPI0024170621|nr:hypothetical protein [Micromonospora sp. WMMD956]MDG4820162.1 hypothetical protein [Micromonospora sp. WMMD956]
MTITPIRPHRTTTPVDFEALTQWELRVIFYAANYQQTVDEMMSPTGNIPRMAATIVAVIDRYGFDLIRQVANLAGHAMLTRNYQMQGELFPDANRWRWTESTAGVFLRGVATKPPFLTVQTVCQRWNSALAHDTATVQAVA